MVFPYSIYAMIHPPPVFDWFGVAFIKKRIKDQPIKAKTVCGARPIPAVRCCVQVYMLPTLPPQLKRHPSPPHEPWV